MPPSALSFHTRKSKKETWQQLTSSLGCFVVDVLLKITLHDVMKPLYPAYFLNLAHGTLAPDYDGGIRHEMVVKLVTVHMHHRGKGPRKLSAPLPQVGYG